MKKAPPHPRKNFSEKARNTSRLCFLLRGCYFSAKGKARQRRAVFYGEAVRKGSGTSPLLRCPQTGDCPAKPLGNCLFARKTAKPFFQYLCAAPGGAELSFSAKGKARRAACFLCEKLTKSMDFEIRKVIYTPLHLLAVLQNQKRYSKRSVCFLCFQHPLSSFLCVR